MRSPISRPTSGRVGHPRRRTSARAVPAPEALERRLALAGGDLDPSFGDGGRSVIQSGISAAAEAVAIRPDGGILLAGGSADGFVLTRLDAGGAIDRDFGDAGVRTIGFDGFGGGRVGMALQGDGRIVVVGTTRHHFAVARLTPDGQLDPSFDGDGRLDLAFAVTTEVVAGSIALQPDGKILLAGTGGGNFVAVRLDSDGSLDRSFDGDGKQSVSFGDDRPSSLGALTLQPDGGILLAGSTTLSIFDGIKFSVARLTPAGALDPSFGGDGRVILDAVRPGYTTDRVSAAAVRSDGKIVLAGAAGSFTPRFGVARLNPSGTLDRGFDGDGWNDFTVADLPGFARGLAIPADGRVVLGGTVGGGSSGLMGPSNATLAAARLDAAGALDPSFGDGGLRRVGFEPASSSIRGDVGAEAVAIQPDGRIVLAGYAPGDGGSRHFVVARLLASPVATAPTPTPTPTPPPGPTPTPTPRPTPTPTPTPTPMPTPIVGLPFPRVIGTFFRRGRNAAITLAFDEGLRPASTRNPRSYRLLTAGRDGVFETRDDRALRISSIVYRPLYRTIDLVVAGGLGRREPVLVSVSPTTLASSAGLRLDGDGDGHPGDSFLAILR